MIKLAAETEMTPFLVTLETTSLMVVKGTIRFMAAQVMTAFLEVKVTIRI